MRLPGRPERRKKSYSKLTNGELITLVAIGFDMDPEDIQHTVIIITTTENKLGMLTTECGPHTLTILSEAAIATMSTEFKTTDDCGPHCHGIGREENHCSCLTCHGKPLTPNGIPS